MRSASSKIHQCESKPNGVSVFFAPSVEVIYEIHVMLAMFDYPKGYILCYIPIVCLLIFLPMKSRYPSYKIWLVVLTILKNDGVCQVNGKIGLSPIYYGKQKCSKAATR